MTHTTMSNLLHRYLMGACAKNKNEPDDDSNNMKVLLQLANESYLVSSETTK